MSRVWRGPVVDELRRAPGLRTLPSPGCPGDPSRSQRLGVLEMARLRASAPDDSDLPREAGVGRDLRRVLADPCLVEQLSPAQARSLLVELGVLLTALAARAIGPEVSPARPGESGAERLLTVPQVAERLALPKGRVYELVRRAELPAVHIGKYVRIPADGLGEWLSRRRNAS